MDRNVDCTRIAPALYVGTLSAAHDVELMRKRRIRGILSLHATLSELRSNVSHRTVLLNDGDVNGRELLLSAVYTLNDLLADPSTRPVFVHCKAGSSRAPLLAATILALRNETQIGYELAAIAEKRRIVPNPGLLADFEDLRREVGWLPGGDLRGGVRSRIRRAVARVHVPHFA
jgi:predicted protein tyrosine phosphatase